MILFWIALYLPAVALLLRAWTSQDPDWVRIVGAALGVAAIVVPLLTYWARWSLSPGAGLAPHMAAAAALAVWAAFSSDRQLHRLASIAAAVVGAVPIFLLYQFAAHYSE